MRVERESPRVVIVGGGIGGRAAAYTLGAGPVRVTFVDRAERVAAEAAIPAAHPANAWTWAPSDDSRAHSS